MVHDSNESSPERGKPFSTNDDGNVIRFPPPRPASSAAQNNPTYPPMINLPPLTKYLIAAIVGVHVAVYGIGFFSEALQDQIYNYGAFVPASWSGDLPFTWWTPLTLITFSFLHGGWLHLIVNTVMLMAFGAGIEKWLGQKKMLILFAISSAAAVLCQFVADPHSLAGVVGISGAISGFFGALLLMLQQERMLGNAKNSILPFIVVWVVVSVIFGYMGAPDGSPIAWLAHIGGFVGGLVITWLMLGRPVLFRR